MTEQWIDESPNLQLMNNHVGGPEGDAGMDGLGSSDGM